MSMRSLTVAQTWSLTKSTSTLQAGRKLLMLSGCMYKMRLHFPRSGGILGMSSCANPDLIRKIVGSDTPYTRKLDLVSEQALIVGITAVLIVVNLLPIWLVRFPPLQDYPNHLLSAHIVAHYNDPNFDYAQNFVLSWRPIPNVLGTLIMAGLARIVPTFLAGKLFLSLYIILFPLSIFYLLNAVDSNKLLLGLFGFPLTYSWFFNMGFLNFCFSLPLYFFAVGFWWKTRSGQRNRVKRMIVLGLLTLLIYLAHFLTFGAWIATIALLSLTSVGWRTTIRRGLLLAGLVVAILIPATLIFDAVWIQLRAIFDLITPSVIVFASLPTKLAITFRPFISFRALVEGVILLALLLLYLALMLRNSAQWTVTPFLSLALLMVGLFLVLPVGFREPFYIARRLLILAVILGLPVLYVSTRLRWRLALIGFLTAMSIAHTSVMLGVYRRADAELNDYYAGLQHIPPHQTVLPILRVHRGYVYYYDHAWAYYLINYSGLSPGVFSGRDQLLSYRHRPPLPYDGDIGFAGAMARRHYYVLLREQAKESMETALLIQGFEPYISLGDSVIYKATKSPNYDNRFDVDLVIRNYPYVTIYGREDPDVDPYLLEHYKVIFSQGQMRVL
ncbi:MAG TPA: hypothetical protein EYP49_11190, partial [Anaerolineae bacterium]|nr:hypothetical protein [Anaerolineae bacterium]